MRRYLRLARLAPIHARNIAVCLAYVAWFVAFGRKRVKRRGLGERNRVVAMVTYDHVEFDGRVQRAAIALAESGYSVVVIKPSDTDQNVLPEKLRWHDNVSVRSAGLIGTSSWFPYCFDGSMMREILNTGATIIYCHDVNTFPMGLFAAARLNGAMIGDFHEWMSEMSDWYGDRIRQVPLVKKLVYRRIEKFTLERASAIVTVSRSLGEAMCNELGVDREFLLVRNIPMASQTRAKGHDLRRMLSIPSKDVLMIISGYLGLHRNIDVLIDGLSLVENAQLVLMGTGLDRFGPGWRTRAEARGVSERLHFVGPVPIGDVVGTCASADIGLFNAKDVCLNFHYSLPIKIFEYIMAGLPVVSADLPETRRLVEQEDLGRLFDSDSPESLAEALNSLIRDENALAECARNCTRVRQEFLDTPEVNRVVDLVDSMYEGCHAEVRCVV